MKIEMDVDAGSISETIAETLKSLSPEKREELCVKVMTAWLMEPHDAEKRAYERNLPTHNEWARSEAIKKFVSTRDKMIGEITTATIEFYKKRVGELVENDEQLKTKFEVLKTMLVEKFPEMVQHSMTAWFAKGFSQIGDQFSALFGYTKQIAGLVGEARERLGLPPGPY